MKKLLILFCLVITACSTHKSEQLDECKLKVTSKKVVENSIHLDIYSPCYLHTYPFLIAKAKETGEVVARAELRSFGQRENTVGHYSITLEDQAPPLDQIDLFMVSKMEQIVQEISLDSD